MIYCDYILFFVKFFFLWNCLICLVFCVVISHSTLHWLSEMKLFLQLDRYCNLLVLYFYWRHHLQGPQLSCSRPAVLLVSGLPSVSIQGFIFTLLFWILCFLDSSVFHFHGFLPDFLLSTTVSDFVKIKVLNVKKCFYSSVIFN